MEENDKARLVDGFYTPIEHMFEHWEVIGDKIELRDSFDSFDPRAMFEYGDFGGLLSTRRSTRSKKIILCIKQGHPIS